MESLRPLRLATWLIALAVACDGGSGKQTPDAQGAVMGLGQLCTTAANNCVAPFGCLTFPGNNTSGICSPICVDDGTMMTNAAGGIMSIAPDPRNPPQSTTCSGAFSGSVGTASCDAIFEYSPMDQPVVADKTYAHVGIACTIACGDNNTCPGTLRCDTALGWCVPPL